VREPVVRGAAARRHVLVRRPDATTWPRSCLRAVRRASGRTVRDASSSAPRPRGRAALLAPSDRILPPRGPCGNLLGDGRRRGRGRRTTSSRRAARPQCRAHSSNRRPAAWDVERDWDRPLVARRGSGLIGVARIVLVGARPFAMLRRPERGARRGRRAQRVAHDARGRRCRVCWSSARGDVVRGTVDTTVEIARRRHVERASMTVVRASPRRKPEAVRDRAISTTPRGVPKPGLVMKVMMRSFA